MPVRLRVCTQNIDAPLIPRGMLRRLRWSFAFAVSCGCSGEVTGGGESWSGEQPAVEASNTSVTTGPVVQPNPGVTSGGGLPGGSSSVVEPAPTTTPTNVTAAPTTAPVVFAPSPGAYRRLTNAAFTNSLRDLLNGPVEVGALEPDSWAVGGLPTVGAAVVSISELGVEQYQKAVEDAVEVAFADPARRDAILGCAPSGVNDTACFEQFVIAFGRKAFRQPLSEALVARYTKLVGDVAVMLDDAMLGMKAGVTAFLSSPHFLYRMERGEPDGASAHWRYTSHETAARLAYFLTNSTPDAELLDLADQDALLTVDAVRAQSERLLSSPAGRESVANFARELFQLRLVAMRAKDPELYPEYDAELQQAMMQEVPAMFASVVFDQRASAMELFTTRNTFATKELAALYGVQTPPSADGTLSPITWPEERAGLLGASGILAIYGSQKEGSPTLRGKFVREVLLCQAIPAPPADVSTTLEDPPAGQVFTKREKLTRHQEQPTCAACHALLDPLGLTLETYDAIGRYRTTDQGKPIDVSGNLDGTAFNGGVELGALLASKPETAKCMARNLYRYATGHVELPSESPVLTTLTESFTSGGFDLQKLMLEIVTSDGFRHVAPPTP